MANMNAQVVAYGVSASQGGGTKNIVNVFNFQRTTDVNPLSKTNIEGAFNTAIMTPMLAALSVDYTQTHVTVRFIDDALDAPASVTRAGVGAIAGERLPDYNAAVVQLKTSLRGRRYRGSKHFGPIAESDTDGDLLVPAAQTRFNTLGTAIVTGFTDADGNVWKSTIVSSMPPAQYKVNPTTVVATIVISKVLNKSVGTMRRRKVKTVN